MADAIKKLDVDVFIGVDTRITTLTEAREYGSIRKRLPSYSLNLFPTQASTSNTLHNDVGAISILISPRFAAHVAEKFYDPLRFGVVGAVRLDFSSAKILIIGAYWMPKPTSQDSHLRNSLWFRLERALAASKFQLTPLEYVQRSIEDLLELAYMKGWKVICTADFNGGYGHDSGVYKDVKPWLDDHFLDNLPHSYAMKRPGDSNLSDLTTRGAVSLDYITTNLPGFTYQPFRSSSLQHIDTISDHKPIFADFHGPSLRTKPVYRPPQHSHLDLDLKSKSDVETFQNILNTESAPQPPGPQATYADHAHYIDALCDFSVQSAAYL